MAKPGVVVTPLSALLEHAASPDANVRRPAEEQLALMEEESFPQYVTALCEELRDVTKPPQSRHLAGLLLKNTMSSKVPQLQFKLQQRWMSLTPDVRTAIKHAILTTLGAPLREARSTAAMVVAKIAACELPHNQWPDLIRLLLHNIEHAPTSDLKQSTFETLGYVCEECPAHLQSESSVILNAIAKGMTSDEQNASVKLAATRALANSLEFAKNNMEQPTERTMIMTMLVQAASFHDANVRVAAFLGLVKVASQYYEHIAEYMDSIFTLTKNAIANDTEDVAMQALEFWSSICDVEIDAQHTLEDFVGKERPNDFKFHHLMHTALPHLCPVLLSCLSKQSELAGDETWNVAMAAGLCLSLAAQTVGNDIAPQVIPFVERNITDSNWRNREAATLAFASILNGPSQSTLAPLVETALPVVLNHMKDHSLHVRDTAAWTLGRICELTPRCINESVLQALMEAFIQGLKDEPNVSAHVCWGIHSLAEIVAEQKLNSPLNRYFHPLIAALLEAAERTDMDDTRLLVSSYEAMNVLIRSSSDEVIPIVEELLPTLVIRLEKIFAEVTEAGIDHRLSLHMAALCGSLQIVIRKLSSQTIEVHSDRMMMHFLQALRFGNSTLQEDAMMAAGALFRAVQGNSVKYFDSFKPFLIAGLKASEEIQLCLVSVGVVSDLMRAIGDQMVAHTDDIMGILLHNLQGASIDRVIKPHIISCIGDIALAVKGWFSRYAPFVLPLLVQASTTQFGEDADYDAIDYLQNLRLAILDAFMGILAGMGEVGQADVFTPYLDATVSFLNLVANDQDTDERVLNAANGLIGDIVQNFGPAAGPLKHHRSVELLIRQGHDSTSAQCRESASWAEQMIMRLPR